MLIVFYVERSSKEGASLGGLHEWVLHKLFVTHCTDNTLIMNPFAFIKRFL